MEHMQHAPHINAPKISRRSNREVKEMRKEIKKMITLMNLAHAWPVFFLYCNFISVNLSTFFVSVGQNRPFYAVLVVQCFTFCHDTASTRRPFPKHLQYKHNIWFVRYFLNFEWNMVWKFHSMIVNNCNEIFLLTWKIKAMSNKHEK